MNIYFISGLATNCDVFRNIHLPSQFNMRCLPWLEPDGDEALEDYIQRLAEPIDTEQEFAIVGLSFGGMIAIELTKKLKPKDTIIISSVPTYDHIPLLFRITGSLRLYNFAPTGSLKYFRPIIDWFIGAKRSKEELELLHKTLATLSPRLLKWSLKQLTLRWRNTIVQKNLFHIHGTADRLLPLGKMKADVLINGGSHFMIVSHGKEISDILSKRLGGN